MEFERLNWAILDRLRHGFLSGQAAKGPYWTTVADLEQYDLTYGERIGWKWDAVLHELERRGWVPPTGSMLDWGCGSGVAGRRVAARWPAVFTALSTWDHSPLARDYALRRLSALPSAPPTRAWHEGEPMGTLVLSHILTELNDGHLRHLRDLIRHAQAVLWIEPGTRDTGRALAALRDELKQDFRVVAPCTHAQACPLFSGSNDGDWCHFFAHPPKGLYADSDWVKFGHRAGIDLRSLPYSYLVLDRRASPSDLPTGTARILGRPELHKAHARWLQCDAQGLEDITLTKRADPAFYKTLEKRPGLPLIRVQKRADGVPSRAEEIHPRAE